MSSLSSNLIWYDLSHLRKRESNPTNKNKNIHVVRKLSSVLENELTICNKCLYEIPNYESYFYICRKSHALYTTEMDLEVEVEVEVPMRNKLQKHKDSVLLEFRDSQLILMDNFLHEYCTDAKQYIYYILAFYTHLLDALQLLESKRIIHNSLTSAQIPIDNNIKVPLITWFGDALDTTTTIVQQLLSLPYDASLVERPLELHLFTFLQTNKLHSLSMYNIECVLKDVCDNDVLQAFGLVSSFVTEGMHYFAKYENQSKEYILQDIVSSCFTWDNYALSIIFLRFLISISQTVKTKTKFITKFIRLLLANIHVDPGNRSNVVDGKQAFAILLDTTTPKEFQQLIRLMS